MVAGQVVEFPYTPGAVADKGDSGRSGSEAGAMLVSVKLHSLAIAVYSQCRRVNYELFMRNKVGVSLPEVVKS